MRLLPVIDRLTAQCPSLISVEPARSLSAIDDAELEAPAAYVYPVADAAPPNAVEQVVRQRAVSQFAVLVAARNIDAISASEPLEDTRDAVREALLGWQGPYDDQLEYVRGDVLEVTSHLIWWREIYAVAHFLRSTP